MTRKMVERNVTFSLGVESVKGCWWRFSSLLFVQLVCWLKHSSSDTFVGFYQQQHLLLLNLSYFAYVAGGLSTVTRKAVDRNVCLSWELNLWKVIGGASFSWCN